jgi:SAM-dependent methyltransferase
MEVSFTLQLDPPAAFDALVDELRLALSRLGIDFETGSHGKLLQAGDPIGRVTSWNPPAEIVLAWIPAPWQSPEILQLDLRVQSIPGGTRVTLNQPDWYKRLDNNALETAGWFAGQVFAPLLSAMSPQRFGDWITDRRARRPSGPQARTTYRDPIYHRPNFLAILEVLQLRPEDHLVEIGCGGGALLQDALKSGCRAAAIDHSADMVRTASELNRSAIAAGRLEIRQADAAALPFPANAFTCAIMTGVFGFIEQPQRVLAEIARVLAPGARFVLFTATKELRGTPAAPEPVASRLHYYEDDELLALARQAGFAQARVEHPDFEPLAIQAGVPEEALPLFRNRGTGQLLVTSR